MAAQRWNSCVQLPTADNPLLEEQHDEHHLDEQQHHEERHLDEQQYDQNPLLEQQKFTDILHGPRAPRI